jgi:hypothetical protein
MRKTFARVDDVLIERLFQPASDLITYCIGLSRTTTTCFCIDVACLSWIVSRARGLADAVAAWDASAAFLAWALLLLGIVALMSLRMLFRRAGLRQINPLRRVMLPHRAIALLMLVSSAVQLRSLCVADAADLAMVISAASALYLGACAERPPIRRGAPSLAPAAGRT